MVYFTLHNRQESEREKQEKSRDPKVLPLFLSIRYFLLRGVESQNVVTNSGP